MWSDMISVFSGLKVNRINAVLNGRLVSEGMINATEKNWGYAKDALLLNADIENFLNRK